MNITQVALVTVPVSDQDVAKDFYAGLLGFTVLEDRSMGPMRWLQVAPEGRKPAWSSPPICPARPRATFKD
nr:hypothetical protein GCM10020093_101610 [Planobispora longispora]